MGQRRWGGEVREEQAPHPLVFLCWLSLPLLKNSLERDVCEALILGQNHLKFVYNINQSWENIKATEQNKPSPKKDLVGNWHQDFSYLIFLWWLDLSCSESSNISPHLNWLSNNWIQKSKLLSLSANLPRQRHLLLSYWSMIHGPAASASPGSLLEMQTLSSYLDHGISTRLAARSSRVWETASRGESLICLILPNLPFRPTVRLAEHVLHLPSGLPFFKC